jgi:hypothetical protein
MTTSLVDLPEIVDFTYLSNNPNLTIDIIVNNLDKPWNMLWLSSHQSITLNTILKYPDLNWDIIGMIHNPNITMNQIQLLKNSQYILNGIDFIEKKYNSDLTDDIVAEINGILQNKKTQMITMYNFNSVVNDINANWNWEMLSMRVPISFILNNTQYPWACFDPVLRPEKMLEYFASVYDKTTYWNWDTVLKNMVAVNEIEGWNWDFLSQYVFTPSFYTKYPELPWNWRIIIKKNLYLNRKFVSLHIDLINMYDDSELAFMYRLPDVFWTDCVNKIM